MDQHKVLCRNCGNEGNIPFKAIGKRASCGICGTPMVVPTVEEEAQYREELKRQKGAEAEELRRLKETQAEERKRRKQAEAEERIQRKEAKRRNKEAKAQAARERKDAEEERRELEFEAREKHHQEETRAGEYNHSQVRSYLPEEISVLEEDVIHEDQRKKEISPADKSAGSFQNTKQVLGIIGSILLILGVFFPIVSFLRLQTSFNLFDLLNSRFDNVGGYFVLGFAVLSLISASQGKTSWLWIPGLMCAAVIILSLFLALGAVGELVHLSYGWIVLAVGTGLLLWSGSFTFPRWLPMELILCVAVLVGIVIIVIWRYQVH